MWATVSGSVVVVRSRRAHSRTVSQNSMRAIMQPYGAIQCGWGGSAVVMAVVLGLARVGRTLRDQRRYDCSSSGGWPT